MQQWLAIMCLYAGVVSGRTQEVDHQQASSNISKASSSLPDLCFYRQPTDCPDLDADSNQRRCKRIENDGALCCNTDRQTLDSDLYHIGKHHTVEAYLR